MPRAIVIGGGICGLTTAIALSRKGWEVTVHEASPALRPVGKGIWVPINAMQVLGRLGLAGQVSECGLPLERIELQTAAGAPLSTFNLGELAARYGHTLVSILRADLVKILASALPAGVLCLESQLTHFSPQTNRAASQEPGPVRAFFKDGSDAAADLLVGADGIHSRVREQLFPGVAFRYSGQTCFRGVAELALPGNVASTCREIWGGRNRFGFSPVGKKHVYWFAPQIAPAGVDDPIDTRMARLLDEYRRFPSPVPEILAATRGTDTIRTDLFDFKPISAWSRQNIVLLGDAAHAMTPNLGQGGAQAIEDAFVLAEQLAQVGSVAEALASYERIRMPRIRHIVKTSWSFGQIAHWQNPLARWVRDTAVRCTPDSTNIKEMDRLCNLEYL